MTSSMKKYCKDLKITSASASGTANIATATATAASSFSIFGSSAAVAGGVIAATGFSIAMGTDIAYINDDCGDIPFNEIKDILKDRFNELDLNIDRNYDAIKAVDEKVYRTHLAVINNFIAIKQVEYKVDRNFQATKFIEIKVDRNLKELQIGFDNVNSKFDENKNHINKVFKELKDYVRQSKIEDLTSRLISIIDFFLIEQDNIREMPIVELPFKLDSKHGIIKRLESTINPYDKNSLPALLNDIINQRYAIPNDANDKIAFVSLDLLTSGLTIYTSIMLFILKCYGFLAERYYDDNELKIYNDHLSNFGVIYNDLKNTLNGVDGKNGLIDKVLQVLNEVRDLSYINEYRNDIVNFVLNQKDKLTLVQNYSLDEPIFLEKPSMKAIKYDFLSSQIMTPIGNWKSGEDVSYAMQYKKGDVYSPVGEWSTPIAVKEKANPIIHIGVVQQGITRIIFRNIGRNKPELVGIIEDDKQTIFSDINRDVYNAASNSNGAVAIRELDELIDNGANITALFENDRQAIHAVTKSGNVEVLLHLIKRGADINARDRNKFTPIHLAVENDDHELVNVLIEHGANLTAITNQNWTPMHIAVARGNIKIVNALKLSVGLNSEIKGGFSPLHVAVSYGNIDVVRTLLDDDQVDVNKISEKKLTALHLASICGQTETIELLLNHKDIDVNSASEGGLTAIHYASLLGNLEVVKQLIKRKDININAKSADGWRPLHLSIMLNMEEVTFELLNVENIEINGKGKQNLTPLHLAAPKGQIDIINKLLKQDASLTMRDESGNTPLHIAAEMGSLCTVSSFTDHGANINSQRTDGYTPLQLASLNGREDIVRFLINKQANVHSKNKDGMASIDIASRKGYENIVKLLVKNSGSVGANALNCAAYGGNFEILEYLIERGGVINKTDQAGRSPVYHASSQGHEHIVIYLIEKKSAEFKVIDNNENTPLHAAALNGHVNLVKYFVQKGIYAEARDKYSNTPLHMASWNGYTSVVRYLLEEAKCDINSKNSELFTPLHLAAMNGHRIAVKYLADNNADVNIKANEGWSPLLEAAYENEWDIVKILIVNGADSKVSNIFGNALHFSTRDGQATLLKRFVKDGTDVNGVDNDGRTPLFWAVRNNNLYIAKLLLKNGANHLIADKYGMSILHIAAIYSKVEIVKYLVEEKNINTNIPNNSYFNATPLHLSAANNNYHVVQYLVEMGAPINVIDDNGTTPLLQAAINSYWDIVNYLAEKNANVQISNNDKNTCLHEAAKNASIKTAENLVNKGADIVARDNVRRTPLHLAASSGKLDIMKYLIKNGANVNDTDITSNTALHYAASSGNLNMIKYLINEKNLNIYFQNKDSKTPLHIASVNGNLNVVKYLIEEQKANYNPNIYHVVENGYLGILQYLTEINGANLNLVNSKEKTLLHIAAEEGHLNIVEYLVKEKNIDIEKKDCFQKDAFYYASVNDLLDIVKYFIEETGFDFDTNLFIAVREGYGIGIVKYLIRKFNTDLNANNNNGQNLVHIAAGGGHFGLVKYLIEKGVDDRLMDNEGDSVLHYATIGGNLNLLKYFIDERNFNTWVDIKNNKGIAPLHMAFQTGQLDIVKYLIDQKLANVNGPFGERGNTPLHLVAFDGNVEMATFLIERGADANIQNNDKQSPIHVAAIRGHLHLIRYMIDNKFTTFPGEDIYGYTPLIFAARSGHLDIVKYLIEHNDADKIQNKVGKTPLHEAIKAGHLNIVRYLIDQNHANVDSLDNVYVNSPLQWAANFEKLEIAGFLVERGADVNSQNKDGHAPVHNAAYNGAIIVLKYLVDQKHADVNAKSLYNNTPLLLAALMQHWDIVKYLIEKKEVDINTKNNDGETVFTCVMNWNQTELINILNARGAQRNRHSVENLLKPRASASSFLLQTIFPSLSNITYSPADLVPYLTTAVVQPNLINVSTPFSDRFTHSNKTKPLNDKYLVRFSGEACACCNMALITVFQSLVDKNFPTPVFTSLTDVDMRAAALNISDNFRYILYDVGVSFDHLDFFDIYLKVLKYIKKENFSQIKKYLYELVKDECPMNCERLAVLKNGLQTDLTSNVLRK